MSSRRLLPTALAAGLIGLAGCGGGGESTDAAESVQTTTAPAETATAPTTTSAPPPAATPKTITIRVTGGQPEGGIARPKIEKDQKVLLVVRSDTADEIHVHGYDLSQDVAAGGTARIAFVAAVRGRFEVELEGSGVQLAELTVR